MNMLFTKSKRLISLIFMILSLTLLNSKLYLADPLEKLEIETTDLSTGKITKEYLIDYSEDTFFPFLKGSTGTLGENASDEMIYTPDKVIGNDDRNIIEDTTRIPYRYIGLLRIEFKNNITNEVLRGSATAFLVGKKSILTAAHCAYKKDYTLESAIFYPANNGSVHKFGYYEIMKTHVPTKYKNEADAAESYKVYTAGMQKYDFALLELDYDIGLTLGYFGLGGYNTTYNKDTLVGKKVTIVGYPKEKGSTLWRHKDEILSFDEAGIIMEYQIDTEEGQSGAPIIYPVSGSYYVVGINVSQSRLQPYNHGRYVTKNVYELVKKYNTD